MIFLIVWIFTQREDYRTLLSTKAPPWIYCTLCITQSALDILHRAHNSQKFKAQARKLPSIALENIDPRTALRVQNSQMQVSPKGKLPTTQH